MLIADRTQEFHMFQPTQEAYLHSIIVDKSFRDDFAKVAIEDFESFSAHVDVSQAGWEFLGLLLK